MLSFNPRPFEDQFDNLSPQNMQVATGRPHVLVSASASEAAVFDIPFISPYRALDLGQYQVDELGHVRVYVFNELRSVTPDVDDGVIVITAQFLDAELYLPHDSDIALASKIASKQEAARFVTESKGGEATKKAMSNSITSRLASSAPVTSAVKNTRNVIGRAFTRVLENAGSIAATTAAMAMVGLSKPTTLDFNTVLKVNPYSDTASGKGIDTSIKLAMDPENAISTVPNVGGMSDTR
jgi:hypothetical protein